MYYEEKFIKGILHSRSTPDGQWFPLQTDYAGAANLLKTLSAAERMEVFGLFCTSCGAADPKCQCWNDE